MDFPHMNDTGFPHLNNVNVYAYRNDFDYTRWKVNTELTLTNVLWNSDYNDVVKFDTNEVRDKWFDEQEDVYKVKLRENQQMPPQGGIKLPIPFAVASRYNYLFVDIPVMPGSEPPIDYETDYGIRRWYFFVDTVEYKSSNATMFTLSLDVWTQYQNDVDIKYLYLERGHAPVAATDVDEYLSNPIENNRYLLTPDVAPSNAQIVRHSDYIPFGNGEKWLCIASTCPPSGFSQLGSIVHDSSDYTYGNITYSDYDARYGYQLVVHGFGVGNGDDYSDLRAPSAIVNPNSPVPNNVFMYAIPASDVYGSGALMSDVSDTCPQFLNTVLGCFMVSRDMISLGTRRTLAGHTIYEVTGTEQEEPYELPEKGEFGFGERYERFAKLYTYPYSCLEITDNDGKTATVRIENTRSMACHKLATLAFPYMNLRMFLTGINGVGSTTYRWMDMNGANRTREMPQSDWFDFCFDNQIPCYALYMDAETAWYLDNFNKVIKSGRQSALVAYHNAVRPANTQRANVIDSDATMYANADRDAGTLVTNTDNTADTIRANADLTIANNTLMRDLAILSGDNIKDSNNKKSNTMRNAANTFTTTTSSAQAEQSVATALNGGANTIMGQAGTVMAGMAVAGGMAGSVLPGVGNLAGIGGGLAAGALVGMVGAVANAASGYYSATASSQVTAATATAQVACNDTGHNATETNNNEVQSQLDTDISNKNTNTNTLFSRHTDNNNDNNKTNARNTAATMRNNAAASQATGDSNATYTRETSVLNAKESLENARRPIQYAMRDAANQAPRPIGSYAGNMAPDANRTRGLQIKLRTMTDSEVAQVGDQFARYGYALNQVWDVAQSGLCPMKHFCYWKCKDAWVDDRRSSNNAVQQLITAMFDKGVTIWNNPSEVGKVSIYDN